MKKTYINPEMRIVKLMSQRIMAGSLRKGEGSINAEDSDAREDFFSDDDFFDEDDY